MIAYAYYTKKKGMINNNNIMAKFEEIFIEKGVLHFKVADKL